MLKIKRSSRGIRMIAIGGALRAANVNITRLGALQEVTAVQDFSVTRQLQRVLIARQHEVEVGGQRADVVISPTRFGEVWSSRLRHGVRQYFLPSNSK
jgi:hypothetical protein